MKEKIIESSIYGETKGTYIGRKGLTKKQQKEQDALIASIMKTPKDKAKKK